VRHSATGDAADDRENEAGTPGGATGTPQGAGPRRRRLFPPSRRGVIVAVVAGALVAGGGLTASALLGGAHGPGGRPAADDGFSLRATAAAGARPTASAAPPVPQVASSPHLATMPPSAGAAGGGRGASAAAAGHPTASDGSAPSGSSTSSPGDSASTGPMTTGSASCPNPSFSTSAPLGMWNLSPYWVANDMWNASGYSVTQTIHACSYSNWYVTATMNNDSGNGAVKTYPNAQRDFNSAISSLSSVTSTFAETSPGTGIWEDTYDIWINGLATSGSTEIMIWTQNHGQTPSGSDQGTVTLDGRSYTVWKSGSYIAFVANTNFTAGTMNLLGFFQWVIGKDWMPADSTLSQVCYGAELVSTNGVPATFTFSNFSVSAS
jgi:Glycosyl hydrolase family 12